MHELSIVKSIVDIAEDQVQKAGARAVEKIELEIGYLAGVEWQALDFVWEMGVKESVLERSERQIDRIPGKARCMECGQEYQMQELYDACPQCNSYFNEILQGKELRVKALTVI